MITILAVGKKHESWISEGLERYEKRLKMPFNVEWVLLPHSSLEQTEAREEESERLLSKISHGSFVVLLDETGKNSSTPDIASLFENQFVHAKPIVIVIGGAYGVTTQLQNRADFVWSLSKLVFPHQLVRLILTEQLYRCQEIARGGKYHHD